MKFFHLSDLHIGKVVNSFPMIPEQRHIFKQIIEYIKTEKPDAVIIAGDIYDRAIPGVEAVKLFDDFLTDISDEDVTVMLISGNHDSPERLNFASRLLSKKKLFLCGAFDGTLQKVVLADEFGDVNFWLLPFIKPISVRCFFSEREIETYDEALNAILETADIDYSARNVLVSHQFYTKAGITPTRSESELNPVGGLDAINCGLIEKFDYAALGHLHGAQSAGADHIRYAGSPIKYSFSECYQKKSISMITLNKKNSLEAKTLPLTPIHDMREIRGEIDKLISSEIASLADSRDYLRVTLTDEEEIMDPMDKLRSVYPNIMYLDFDNAKKNINSNELNIDSEKIVKLSPYDLFMEFFRDMQSADMTDEQAEIVRELLEKEDEL